jgi:hypothetical protein
MMRSSVICFREQSWIDQTRHAVQYYQLKYEQKENEK